MTSGPTAIPGAEGTRHHYAYDAWNRLIGLNADDAGDPGAAIATYRYDGLNRRIQRTLAGAPAVVYAYYYNTAWQVLEERKDGSGGPYAQYVWSLRYIDAPIARSRDADGNAGNGLEEVLFYLGDANMNVTALVNASGGVVERVTYDAYGRPTFRQANYALQEVSGHDDGTASLYDNAVLYCGYRYDLESGTYQVRWRQYQPPLGWIQRDPLAGTGPSPKLVELTSTNLYQYVSSQPIIDRDPSGLLQFSRLPTVTRRMTQSELDSISPAFNPVAQRLGGHLSMIKVSATCICLTPPNRFGLGIWTKDQASPGGGIIIFHWSEIFLLKSELYASREQEDFAIASEREHEEIHDGFMDVIRIWAVVAENSADMKGVQYYPTREKCESSWTAHIQEAISPYWLRLFDIQRRIDERGWHDWPPKKRTESETPTN